MARDLSEVFLSLEAVLVYTFAFLVILIIFLLSSGCNSRRDLWGCLAMSEDQIMLVFSVAFVAKYAGASMSSFSSLASMLS